MDVYAQALKGAGVVDKIKSFLPFNTISVFDLAAAPDAKNLGPNEVGKSDLAKLPGADNKFDTATPGERLPLSMNSCIMLTEPCMHDCHAPFFSLAACTAMHAGDARLMFQSISTLKPCTISDP